jgi:hypothetical protein
LKAEAPLDAQPVLEAAAHAAQHGLLVAADRALGQGRDLVGQLLRARERLAPGYDLVDESDPLRLAHVDAPAGDDELHRLREAHDQRQPRREPVATHDVPAPLEGTELGVLGGDAYVGEQRGLEPGRERVAVDRGDDRLEDVHLARVAAGARQIVEIATIPVEVAELRELRGILQVPAGAEGRLAGAGDDEHERVVVVPKTLPGVVQLLVHDTADRVVLLRPVVGQRDDVTVLLVAKGLVGHRVLHVVDVPPVGGGHAMRGRPRPPTTPQEPCCASSASASSRSDTP